MYLLILCCYQEVTVEENKKENIPEPKIPSCNVYFKEICTIIFIVCEQSVYYQMFNTMKFNR